MEGWKKIRLDEFVKFQRGFDLPKDKFVNGLVPVYGLTLTFIKLNKILFHFIFISNAFNGLNALSSCFFS
jgi:hypothetical protein